ncbi:MAG: hypothetical protein E6J39_04475 [Chloroflexi bacterium]|nr:MAG: hypothetical protein E6J39_04475 [Chloroflexota bacterium]
MIGSEQRRGSGGAAVLGALLIALGLIFLADQYWNLDLGRYGWPIYVIGLGLAGVLLGLTQRNGSGLTIFGSMATILGLILFYQNLTDHWDSWSYAWTLIAPGAVGSAWCCTACGRATPGWCAWAFGRSSLGSACSPLDSSSSKGCSASPAAVSRCRIGSCPSP